jgi:thiamine biosynthesis lipoprotein ApbE
VGAEVLKKENSFATFHRSVFAMNTCLDVLFWGNDQLAFENAFQKIVDSVEKIELTISRYNEDSELFRLNKHGYPHPFKVSDRLMGLINVGATFFRQSNGYFNISLGHQFHQLKNGEKVELPSSVKFEDRVAIDPGNRTVQFLQPNISLDFGGMGKGVATKAIAEIIGNHGIKNAFINFGGSSILTRGSHPHGDYWPFSLAGQHHSVWKLNNDCLSISSLHRDVLGQKTIHVLNPFNAGLEITARIVVVQSENPIEAEVLSTALIAAPETEHSKISPNFKTAEYTIISSTLN